MFCFEVKQIAKIAGLLTKSGMYQVLRLVQYGLFFCQVKECLGEVFPSQSLKKRILLKKVAAPTSLQTNIEVYCG